MTGGPWNRSKVEVHGPPVHVCPLDPNQSHDLSFPIVHLPAGRLTCANSGEIFVADPPFSGFMNGGRQNFPPNSDGSQANRSSDRLYMLSL